ncbi:hypothetical protein HJ162_15240 [Vibrio parahaemolyticus]|nr:hypothetical protein [Vibrio parahaemolyticus]
MTIGKLLLGLARIDLVSFQFCTPKLQIIKVGLSELIQDTVTKTIIVNMCIYQKKGIKGEYSWNDDGTRHDKHKFPNNDKGIGKARELASDALSVPVSSLEFITAISGGIWYKFHSDHDRFSTYVHKHKIIVVLQAGSNILTVIIDDE